MDLTEFWTVASANSIVFDKPQLEQIKRYHDELIYWNNKVNLISRKDKENVFDRHILHSLGLYKYLEEMPNAKVLDIGSGGGLPGIPLKIALPDLNMVLVDSISKKTKITDMLAKHTGLIKISTICARVEELRNSPEFRASFDFIIARGVAPIKKIIAWSREIIKPGGKYLLLKGGDLTDEIIEAKNTFKNLIVKEENLVLFGAEWTQIDQKKVIICVLK